MWPDGICKVADGRYTKTIQFQDINYQLSQNEDKTAIFEGWCDFLNYFDSSIRFQLSFLNLAASQETFANSITIPAQGDDLIPSGWSTRRCCKTSWRGATTASSRPST